MRGAIPPLPQEAFMAWCLVKHRDNFTFTYCIKKWPTAVIIHKLNVYQVVKVKLHAFLISSAEGDDLLGSQLT
jgi:hypothetical protein